ncbi:MAG TPA: hypothetical protein VI583_06555 [Cyclobacteriaceae bacterium]|nr:hypothetical protein [Cyclobacteriaceae bacterium]
MNYTAVRNNVPVPIESIPILEYETFLEQNIILAGKPDNHCVNYYGHRAGNKIRLICCMASDMEMMIYVSSSLINSSKPLPSFTRHRHSFEKFEREIAENFGISYIDHPWLKPVRYAFDRHDRKQEISGYPFFRFHGDETHEVGVGPIHAGIIEPGHFRFMCNGEQILHLEIQLGYQHRGIERLFIEKDNLLSRTVLAESIAGDTVAGHTAAFVNLWEGLCGYQSDEGSKLTRTLGLELERVAVHTGDMSALCTDIAWQLGSSVYGRLRTPVINFFQSWCGNRLAKGLIRAGKNNYPLTGELKEELLKIFEEFLPAFHQVNKEASRLPSVLSRFERTGILTGHQAADIGAVGMTARMCGIRRDIRLSHPHDLYPVLGHQPVLKHHGDVYSRFQIRREEIKQSIGYIKKIMENIPEVNHDGRNWKSEPMAGQFSVSLVEGWRGEICHCAITGENGRLVHYKIKDPSFHNWLALALAVRNNEISDFPVCNKSFNLSHCGHDL